MRPAHAFRRAGRCYAPVDPGLCDSVQHPAPQRPGHSESPCRGCFFDDRPGDQCAPFCRPGYKGRNGHKPRFKKRDLFSSSKIGRFLL